MKSTKQYLFLFFLLLMLKPLLAKNTYLQGTISLLNGTSLEGLLQIPSTPKDKKIKFKKHRSAKAQVILSDSIASLKVITNSPDREKYTFVFTDYEIYKKKQDTVELYGKKIWLMLDYTTKNMNAYSASSEYLIEKDGTLSSIGLAHFKFFVKKADHKYPLLVNKYNGSKNKVKYYINSLSYYCQDIPPLAKKIKNGDYAWDRLYEIVEAYNWYIEKK